MKHKLDSLEEMVNAQYEELKAMGYEPPAPGRRGAPKTLAELERAIEIQHQRLVAEGVLTAALPDKETRPQDWL